MGEGAEVTTQWFYDGYYDYGDGAASGSILDLVNLTALGILATLAIVTNMMSLVAMERSGWLRTQEDGVLILFSLAVADLLTGLGIPIMMWAWSFSTSYGLMMILEKLTSVSMNASVVHLLVLTLDRFVAISHPLHHSIWFTRRCMGLALSCVWFGSLVGPVLYFSKGCPCLEGYTSTYTTDYTNVTTITDASTVPLGGVIYDTICYGLGLVLMFCLHGKMLRIAARAHQRNIAVFNVGSNSRVVKPKLKASKTVACILLVYIVTWQPYVVARLIAYFRTVPGNVVLGTYIVSLSNSCSNFFIYAWSNRRFKKAFRETICCWKTRYEYN